MADALIAFGTWVRLRRQALVLSCKELARRVGCAEVIICKIEADERSPSQQIAELLAVHLGVSEEQRELFVRVARGMVATSHLSPHLLLRQMRLPQRLGTTHACARRLGIA